ncbi:MAG: SMP-30/gluconolactonase/LRE family protein [Gemmataceae bacterium]
MTRLVLSIFSLAVVGTAAVAQDAPPAGEVQKHSFRNSRIFPGTQRDYWIYIPKQYDPAKPACVHVNQDGIQFNAPKVFDRLIHEKKMPVTIGVFIMHGRVLSPNPETALDRFNRSYEYDGLGDQYAKFLLEEILPEVETKSAADGRAIKLSKSGNDRSIGGTSSGAICAFTAAWERPDAFSRVFSGIGTYVGLRGGHNYSTLIRKYEPKPIRLFLEDGSNDLNIYGGDWWMANQAMERSLSFAGYEVEHKWGTGKHNNQHATECFPAAMEFLWKDWPNPVKSGKGSPQMQDILLPDQGWTLVGDGYKFTEGPAVDAKGNAIFCDVPTSKIYSVTGEKIPPVKLANTPRASGAAYGPDGRLYVCGSDKIVAYDSTGQATEIVQGIGGNDLTVLNNGNIYVTNPNANPNDRSRVWLVRPNGEKVAVDSGLGFANGITVSPDQTLLYVADSRSHWVYSYQIQPDGKLAHKQKYYWIHMPDNSDDSGADGLRCDTAGRLYVATKLGIQFCDQAGRVNGIIPTPNGKASNLCFAGPKFDTMIVTANEKVYARKVKVTGSNAFAAPTKPKPPGL